jgi:hypothetical protein
VLCKFKENLLKLTEQPCAITGISIKYFFMLAGSKDLMKPDRMVIRFLQSASGKKFNLEDCQTVLSAVTLQPNEKKVRITPQLLDNAIWRYQRNLYTKRKTGKVLVNYNLEKVLMR